MKYGAFQGESVGEIQNLNKSCRSNAVYVNIKRSQRPPVCEGGVGVLLTQFSRVHSGK